MASKWAGAAVTVLKAANENMCLSVPTIEAYQSNRWRQRRQLLIARYIALVNGTFFAGVEKHRHGVCLHGRRRAG